jgi:hypothetical protein
MYVFLFLAAISVFRRWVRILKSQRPSIFTTLILFILIFDLLRIVPGHAALWQLLGVVCGAFVYFLFVYF